MRERERDVFEQSAVVKNVLRRHLNNHHAFQQRILMLTERGDLLIIWRACAWDGTGLSITRKEIVPADTDWTPALVDARYLSRQAA